MKSQFKLTFFIEKVMIPLDFQPWRIVQIYRHIKEN